MLAHRGLEDDGWATVEGEYVMSWLSQNWVWVVVGLGVLWFLMRSGHRGGGVGGSGCGGSGSGNQRSQRPGSDQTPGGPNGQADETRGRRRGGC